MVESIYNTEKTLEIALVGKYVALHDAYLSVAEALNHAGIANKAKVNIHWIDSETLEDPKLTMKEVFKGIDGIVVPGGFGNRGIEGKIRAVQYARENKVPYLGLCLGMQCAVMEFARNVVGLKGATSSEFCEDAEFPVIDLMPDQVDISEKAEPCVSASIPASWWMVRRLRKYTMPTSFMNAIVTAGNSTISTVRKWSMPA